MNQSLQGKLAVVTGASRGLGKAVARQLSPAGCKLLLLARDPAALGLLAEELNKQGGDAQVVSVDLSDSDDLARASDLIKSEFGDPDILINNAGVGWYQPFLDMDSARFDRMIDLNYRSVVQLCYQFLPAMVARQRGHIVNIASDLSYRPLANMAVYAGTKFALRGFSLSLLSEVKNHGVKVSLINPGMIDSDFHAEPAGSWHEGTTLDPTELARLVLTVLVQPEFQLIDELTVHATLQEY